MLIPEPLHDFDFSGLIEACKDYLDFIENNYHEDKQSDPEHYIFESALMAVFGEDVWDWINNRIEEHETENLKAENERKAASMRKWLEEHDNIG